MKKAFLLFLAFSMLATSAMAEVQDKSSAQDTFYVLDHYELSNFETPRQERYLKGLEKILRSNKKLPQMALPELQKSVESSKNWDEIDSKITQACDRMDDLKNSCDKLAKLRVDTLNAESSRAPEKDKRK